MCSKNFDFRSKSFKKGAHCVEWPHKHLSKVGMARSFYYYQPTTSHKDRVLCSNCNAVFDDWGEIVANPIQRHIGVNPDCFVAKLSKLSAAVSSGTLTLKLIEDACLSSFKGIKCYQSQDLASQGFNCVPDNSDSTVSVGCVACLCYPQIASRRPKHTPQCVLAASLPKLEQETIEASENCSLPEDDSKAGASRTSSVDSKTPSNDGDIATIPSDENLKTKAMSPETIDAEFPKEEPNIQQHDLPLPSALKKDDCIPSYEGLIASLTKSNDSITSILMRIVDNITQKAELELDEAISRLQFTIMEGLKYAHQENIKAVNSEADRVISNILRNVHDDLKTLSTT